MADNLCTPSTLCAVLNVDGLSQGIATQRSQDQSHFPNSFEGGYYNTTAVLPSPSPAFAVQQAYATSETTNSESTPMHIDSMPFTCEYKDMVMRDMSQLQQLPYLFDMPIQPEQQRPYFEQPNNPHPSRQIPESNLHALDNPVTARQHPNMQPYGGSRQPQRAQHYQVPPSATKYVPQYQPAGTIAPWQLQQQSVPWMPSYSQPQPTHTSFTSVPSQQPDRAFQIQPQQVPHMWQQQLSAVFDAELQRHYEMLVQSQLQQQHRQQQYQAQLQIQQHHRLNQFPAQSQLRQHHRNSAHQLPMSPSPPQKPDEADEKPKPLITSAMHQRNAMAWKDKVPSQSHIPTPQHSTAFSQAPTNDMVACRSLAPVPFRRNYVPPLQIPERRVRADYGASLPTPPVVPSQPATASAVPRQPASLPPIPTQPAPGPAILPQVTSIASEQLYVCIATRELDGQWSTRNAGQRSRATSYSARRRRSRRWASTQAWSFRRGGRAVMRRRGVLGRRRRTLDFTLGNMRRSVRLARRWALMIGR